MSILIDRANVNGSDDYHAAHRVGASWAYFKATEGQGFNDSTYHTRRKLARGAGLITGAYMFSDNTTPAAEVDHFLDVIGDLGARPGELRPCIDIERSPHGVPTLEHTIAMAERMHAKLGYWPTLYGSTSVMAPYRAASLVVRACPYWRAEYGPNDGRDHGLAGGDGGAAAHQYTSVARMLGISGFVDESHMLRPDQLIVPTPHTVKHVLPDVAWRWGRWKLGLNEFHGHANDPEMRPRHAPRRIPLGWWRTVRWYQRNVTRTAKKQAKARAAAQLQLDEQTRIPPANDGNGVAIVAGKPASHKRTATVRGTP
jgi:hypothetical protein